jgi:subtilisin family serine protease
MRGSVRRGVGGMLIIALACLAVSGRAAETSGAESMDGPAYSPDAVLVRFDPGAAAAVRATARSAAGASLDVRYTIVPGLERLRVGRGRSVEKTIEALLRNPNVLYAEPDYVVSKVATPDDPSYSSLWGMTNIKAPAAWDVATGSASVVVAVIDSGIDRAHPDLQGNLWTNPDEIPGNGIDDDNNGYVDDVHGWDFHYNDNDPSDIDGHGTHVAGTIGAVGNNALGVVGVNWRVKLVALKGLGDTGSGLTSNLIKALQYARDKAIPISNNSWGGSGYSLSLYDAIWNLQADGHLFVAAAGNDSRNSDSRPGYPASYNLSNIISVASITSSDTLSSFSNYGAQSVDLGAPGSSILSTLPNGGYGTLSGTSMASPHVAGAAALLLSHRPGWTYGQLRETLLQTARPISALNGITTTGGTLDLHAALTTTLQFPEFQLSPTTIDFGEERVGNTSSARTVTVSNTGALAVPIGSISLLAPQFGQFGAVTGCGTTLAVGASCTISVSFTPTTLGLKKATLQVAGDDGAGSRKVLLAGTAIVPEYSLAPGSLEFGEKEVGGSTPAQTITLTNTGKLTLPISGIYESSSSFPLTHNCGASVAVGSSCTISVVFSPYWGGVNSGQVYVYGGDGAATKTVAVSGTGIVPEYSLSPGAMDFGTLSVGQSSEARTVTLTNTGKLTLPISYIGSGYGQFSVNHNCEALVAVGASCTISVAFAPTYGGSINDYIYVYAGGGAESKYVALTGTALVPEYTLSPALLEFGERAFGTSSPSQTVTLTNVGTLPLPITSIGQYAYSFSVTHDCGTTVAAGSSCKISVAFAPQYAGATYEYLYVYGGNGAETKYVELRGTGLVPTYTLSAEALDFGEQGVGSTSESRTLLLANTGKLALPIDSIGLWLQQFQATHNCGTTVAIGGTCTISVTFSPVYANQAFWEYLYVYVGGGAEAKWVSLTGMGVTPLSGHEPGPLLVPASDTDGAYVVSWGAPSTAGVTYVLEEATNPSFTVGRRVVYEGPGLSAAISGRGGLTYYYRVKSKLVGYTDSVWVTGGNGCVVTLPAVTSVALTPSVASPATVGAAVTFAAAAAGGTGSYEYKFLLRLPGGALNVIREYAAQATWSWNTAGLPSGTYQIVVHARSVGSTKTYEAYQAMVTHW